MSGTCGVCGGDVERTNTDGSYKGACADCRSGESPIKGSRHIDVCDGDDCIVCRSYYEEFGEIDTEQDTLF